MELHAWFNPYRSRHPDDTTRPASPLHISRTNPTVVHRYGPFGWMDPGNAFVRRRTVDVVVDVVRRYDVDGVHIDDYFYPYPETRRGRPIPFPDEVSWRAYKAREGTLSRDDWRRRNVDLLVEELHTAIKRTKPWVKFGISPFGIWRPGHPPVVRGFDAYDKLYADSRKWLNEGWLDYWTPQLYWRLSAPAQPYAELLRWWRDENHKGRHLWPGNYTGRASAARTAPWPVTEILDQIRESRAQLSPNSGNVHFSWDAFRVNRDSLNERLIGGPYAEPALVPPSPWLASGLPDAPLVVRVPQPRMVELQVRRIDAPIAEEGGIPAPRRRATATRACRSDGERGDRRRPRLARSALVARPPPATTTPGTRGSSPRGNRPCACRWTRSTPPRRSSSSPPSTTPARRAPPRWFAKHRRRATAVSRLLVFSSFRLLVSLPFRTPGTPAPAARSARGSMAATRPGSPPHSRRRESPSSAAPRRP